MPVLRLRHDFSFAARPESAPYRCGPHPCSLPHGSRARFAAATPPRKDKNLTAKLPPFRGGSFNLAYTDKALSSLKSLEWIDGLDAAVHLPIVQVFGENLVAAGRFRRRKHEGVIELDSVKTLDFECALRQPKGAVHHA